MQDILITITSAIFGLALLLLLASLRLFRRSRKDVFWRRRREAGQRGWRLFVAAFVLFIIGGLSCSATLITMWVAEDAESPSTSPTEVASSGQDLAASATPRADGSAPSSTPPPDADAGGPTATVPSPTLRPTTAAPPADAAPAPSDTSLPSPAPVATTPPAATSAPTTAATLTPQPTANPVVITVVVTATPAGLPTQTAFPTFTPMFTARPLVSSVTPASNAMITITALDDQISDAYTPIDPRDEFGSGTPRIYLFVSFNRMTKGALWRLNLYYEGELIEEKHYLWELESKGEGFFFFGDNNGFLPGEYEIRLYIGERDTPINTKSFVVTDE